MNEITIKNNGVAGHITLTRPKVLNALSHNMIGEIEKSLHQWATDDEIDLVVIDAQGEKAFCAGGDVNLLYARGREGAFAFAEQFWRDEYRLNALIARFTKPYIAFMNGIVMGGGVGISAHGSHRIVTENTRLALPECSIGLIPDVGSTHLLAQAPGFLGEYLALTGYRLSFGEAIYCGFGDYFVPEGEIAQLKEKLLQTGDISYVENISQDNLPNELINDEDEINAIFGLPDLSQIICELDRSTSKWAFNALKSINRSSPLSCKIAFNLVRKSRNNPGIADALKREFRFVSRAMENSDFLEGVRAVIIDKDYVPDWQHTSFDKINDGDLELFFKEAENGDVDLFI